MKPLRAVLLLISACLLPAGSLADDLAEQRELFKQAWQAASRGDQAAVESAIDRLAGYPLTPYLEFELHRSRIDRVPAPVIEHFLARYRDWSFAGDLETVWLRSLGRRGEDELLLRHGRNHADIRVRCYVARARTRAGDTDGLADDIRELWLHGQSRPDECNPAFAWWRRQGNPRPDDAWQRFGLAIDAGESGLARYLRRYLSELDRPWADHWLRLAVRPSTGLNQAARWQDHVRSRELVGWALNRLAPSNWERAEQLWQRFQHRFDWPQDDANAIARRIALFRAVSLDDGAVAAIDRLPDHVRDQQMLEWRLRASLARADWDNVLASIQAMSTEEQLSARWRYWRARALAELGRPEAGLLFAGLATEAHYYGFLSAARLGQPLTLCNRELNADGAIQRRLMRNAEFERALELYRVGLGAHARRTWQRAIRRLGRTELRQAALLAAGAGWHDRAVFALGSAGAMDAYLWRFPIIERGQVETEARRWQVDPALVYGLMRAESAMQADAISPAGARGLLQLMPGTAAAVARRQGLAYSGDRDLTNPAINIPLGIAHLRELQDRFDGDWTRVAAAYNAGIRAAERWLAERPQAETDIWLETLPFFETRDYVPRVLAFATIYEWQLGREPGVLAAHLLGERPEASAFRCPDPDLQAAGAN